MTKGGTRSIDEFTLLQVDNLSDYGSKGRFYAHNKTRCQIYHICNSDSENAFCFAFRTLPSDNTGVPHILEHTVLSGSKNYPLKDPFLALMKGSVATYLNAATYPDKTIYPAASPVRKDFFNLLEVYGDAVFNPLLQKEAFGQEGHHLELQSGGRLRHSGVVYNEMKGAYSSTEEIVEDASYRSLFPNHTYGFDSGGDPAAIPSLTYKAFCEYYRCYYHPSNCLIILYGNIPSEDILPLLHKRFLNECEPSSRPIPSIPPVECWEKPETLTKYYPVSEEAPLDRQSTLMLTWIAGKGNDPFDVLLLRTLSLILLGHAGSPIEKALVDSSLGEDVSPVSGVMTELSETVFTIGLRGSDPNKRDSFRELVFSTLRSVVSNGISEANLNGALRKIEFAEREISEGSGVGLRLMSKVLRGWPYGVAPLDTLSFKALLKRLKSQPSGFFEKIIEEKLLNNPHHALITVAPKKNLMENIEKEEIEALDELQKQLSAEEINTIKDEKIKMDEWRDAMPPDKDCSAIPFLRRKDLPRNVTSFGYESGEEEGIRWLIRPVDTSGIIYVDVSLTISPGDEDIALVPLLSSGISELGLPGIPYEDVAQRITLNTGGITAFQEAGVPFGKKSPLCHFMGSGKFLPKDIDLGAEMFIRLVREADWQDSKRVNDHLKSLKNSFQDSIVPAGMRYAMKRAARSLSATTSLNEIWGGITQFQTLLKVIEDEPETVVRKIEKLRKRLCEGRLLLTISGSRKDGEAFLKRFLTAFSQWNTGDFIKQKHHVNDEDISIEGLTIPSSVGYVGAALRGVEYTSPLSPHLVILAHLLKTGYLWEKIRMEGGAYGVHASYSPREKVFLFGSYRDPRMERTPEIFREGVKYIRDNLVTDVLEPAVIAVAGEEVKPLSYHSQSLISFRRKIYKYNTEIRQRWRDGLLGVTENEVKNAAAWLLSQWDDIKICSLGSPKDIKKTTPEKTITVF